jgi:hypothetical protein
MIAGIVYSFSDESGNHENDESKDCAGRSFMAKVVGVGGVYINTVGCTLCRRKLSAYETGVSQSETLLA